MVLSDKLIRHVLRQDQNLTGNSIYKKKTRHERYHDRVYLFIYEKSASADARKEKKTIGHLTNEKKNNMNNLPSIKRN